VNDRAAVAAAIAMSPVKRRATRQEWAALVKRGKHEDALEAELRSWPREPGVYRRSFSQSPTGMTVKVIKDQQVVVAESGGKFFIALTPEPGTESIRLLPIETVGGFFELIEKKLFDFGASK
jgi:hypothetical protein